MSPQGVVGEELKVRTCWAQVNCSLGVDAFGKATETEIYVVMFHSVCVYDL